VRCNLSLSLLDQIGNLKCKRKKKANKKRKKKKIEGRDLRRMIIGVEIG
jgi:hypothetical protein